MDFLLYDGKVALALLVFYLFYRFLLKKETFHRFNRVVLVGTAVLSFLLPLCIITIHKPIEAAPVVPEPTIVATELPAQELVPLAAGAEQTQSNCISVSSVPDSAYPVLGGSGFCAGKGNSLHPLHREDYPPGAAGPGRGWL